MPAICKAQRPDNQHMLMTEDAMQTMDWTGVRAMVFDMDGTLLNTEQVIVQSASDALEHWGHAPLPSNYAMPNMFGTAADLMVDVLAERGLPLPEGGPSAAGMVFEQFYAALPADAAPLYPGVRKWLAAAHAQGVALGVCTNKQQALAVKGLQAHGIAHYFAAIVGRDSCGIAKPAPQPLWHTLELMGMNATDSVFFGDTHADAACAQAAGVGFVWFSSGFGTAQVHDFAQTMAFADYRTLTLQPTEEVSE